jgi:hypothetical protein
LKESVKVKILGFGITLLGLLLVCGIPLVWLKKTNLAGYGLFISFKAYPTVYRAWLVSCWIIGICFSALGICVLFGVSIGRMYGT